LHGEKGVSYITAWRRGLENLRGKRVLIKQKKKKNLLTGEGLPHGEKRTC
jgi:hypothetical protein